MKYLKKIFENDLYNQVEADELMDFSQSYLSYLLDDTKFKLEVYESPKWNSYIIWLSIELLKENGPFKWNEVKDYYIPFITMLSRQYDLNEESLDQIGSSIIINFYSGNQLFIKASQIEDWSGKLGVEMDTKLFNGNGIKEIGVLVKNTVKR
jgi:hypothetical protein